MQVLKTPFFSFFRVFGEYNGWLLAGFLLMLVLYGIAAVLKRGPAPLQPEERCGPGPGDRGIPAFSLSGYPAFYQACSHQFRGFSAVYNSRGKFVLVFIS